MKSVIIYLKMWAVKLLYPQYWRLPTALIYAQARLETGNFTSNIYRENHNLFGMREAKVRKKTAIGTNRAHALYRSDIDSIRDYFMRQKYFKIKYINDDQYIKDTQDSGYAEATKYVQAWTSLYRSSSLPVRYASYAIVLAILAATFFIASPTLLKSKKYRKKKYWLF